MTVSLALRLHPSIPAVTRDRISAAAVRLGYRPNPLVSALMTQVRGRRHPRYQATLAVIHDADHRDWRTMFPGAHGLAAGLQSRATELGYAVDTFWLRDAAWTEGRLARAFEQRGIAGVVVAPMPVPREEIAFDFTNFAAATIGLSLRTPLLHCATANYFQTVQIVYAHLVAAGCRRIGLTLEPSHDERTQHQWLGAYLVSQATSGRRAVAPLIAPADRERFLRWCQTSRLDAVMSVNPEQHLAWLRDAGRAVPGEICYACLTLSPGRSHIAGAASNPRGIGAAAIDLVAAQLNRNERGAPAEPRILQIPSRWVPGATVPEAVYA